MLLNPVTGTMLEDASERFVKENTEPSKRRIEIASVLSSRGIMGSSKFIRCLHCLSLRAETFQ